MIENELAKIAVNVAFDIHTKLGPGLFESVYETVMEYEFINTYGLHVKRQPPLPVVWKDQKLNLGFRIDLVVENKLILEIKSVETVASVHYKQVLTYPKTNKY